MKMGNTTIVELNHDDAEEIRKNPQKLVGQILEQLSASVYTGREILGGRVIAFFPRWDTPIDKAWARWKARWGSPKRVKVQKLRG